MYFCIFQDSGRIYPDFLHQVTKGHLRIPETHILKNLFSKTIDGKVHFSVQFEIFFRSSVIFTYAFVSITCNIVYYNLTILLLLLL